MRVCRRMSTALLCALAACGSPTANGNPGPGPAPPPPPPPPPAAPPAAAVAYAITNVTVVDPAAGTRQADMTVLTDSDGLIRQVGSATSIPPPAGADLIDGTGLFLSPGLVDVHAHVRTDVAVGDDAARSLGMYLGNGITTIVNMGDFEESVLDMRRQTGDGSLAGPRILAGFQIRGPGDGGGSRTAASPADAETLIDRASTLGYDFLKVYNGLSLATFNRVMSRAPTRGLKVTGHAVRSLSLDDMLGAGVVMVAHAEEYVWTYFASGLDVARIPTAAAVTAGEDAFVTATLSTFEAVNEVWGGNQTGFDAVMLRPGVEFIADGRRTAWERQFQDVYGTGTPGALQPALDFQRLLLRGLHDAGVRILLGTDSPVILGMVPGYSIHEEIRVLTESGFTVPEILRMGTTNAGAFVAELRSSSPPLGEIATGARADLVLLSTDPLTSLTGFQAPEGVMANGRWFDAATLASLRTGGG